MDYQKEKFFNLIYNCIKNNKILRNKFNKGCEKPLH